jgi:hypothetical protein
MGNNSCSWNKKQIVEKEETFQPVYTEKEKSFASRIMMGFLLLSFRKKARVLSDKTSSKLANIINNAKRIEKLSEEENIAEISFIKAIANLKSSIERLKLENEIEGFEFMKQPKDYKDICIAKDEMKIFYMKSLEKHPQLYEFLIDATREKEYILTQPIETQSKVTDQPKQMENSNIFLSALGMGKEKKKKKDLKDIPKHKSIMMDITPHDKENIGKEIDNLFNYRMSANTQNESENSSILIKMLMQEQTKDRFPKPFEKLIHKFTYLALIQRSGSIISTDGKFVSINKPDIKETLKLKTWEQLKKDDMVNEDYKEVFEYLSKTTLEGFKKPGMNKETSQREHRNTMNNPKSKRPQFMFNNLSKNSQELNGEINTSNQNSNSTNNVVSSQTKQLVSSLTPKDGQKISISAVNSPERQIKFKDPFNKELRNTSKMDSITQNPFTISENEDSQEEKTDESFNIKMNQEVMELNKKMNKKMNLKKGIKNLNSNMKKVNGVGVMINSLQKNAQNQSNKNEKLHHIYNGEYDNINYLYCGTGILIKQCNKKYLYIGTFRSGRKHGVGIMFKLKNENYHFYYRGEWGNNKPDGYGLSIIIEEDTKIKIIRRGTFNNGIFTYGTQHIINEKNSKSEIIIEKYEGELVKELYTGTGSLFRKCLKLKKFDDKVFETEYEYEYNGFFVNNLENGTGKAYKNFPLQSYSYTYCGEFENGQMHGEGKITYNGEYFIKSYEGIFERNQKFCKYGIVTFRSNDVYEGFFDTNLQKTKIGLYMHYDKQSLHKEKFFGIFKNDKKNGFGRFLSPNDCKVLVGKYEDGEKIGNFSLVSNFVEEAPEFRLNFMSTGSVNMIGGLNYSTNGVYQSTLNVTTTNPNSPRNTSKVGPIKQAKVFYLFDNDEVVDKSDKPFKD